ncbi:hypothetical protein AV530_012344 [Patagioenas fasciata monilis]|uniref:Secreted protein n=1 Tax=Patagioenas fasciata monilis TaxID=372326 RepID=A0A1V4JBX1_PATFA|nr:hypothetical protein AV530_012344 [Patagioenas fasciata monilis]
MVSPLSVNPPTLLFSFGAALLSVPVPADGSSVCRWPFLPSLTVWKARWFSIRHQEIIPCCQSFLKGEELTNPSDKRLDSQGST